MEITEVRISLREHEGRRLKSYATVTFDNSFVVRNIKIIEGNNGLFVAMPARKVKQFCPRCGKKVEMGSKFCNNCGAQIPPPNEQDQDRQSIHQDLAHPINQQFRDYLQSKVLDAYHQKKNAVEQEQPEQAEKQKAEEPETVQPEKNQEPQRPEQSEQQESEESSGEAEKTE